MYVRYVSRMVGSQYKNDGIYLRLAVSILSCLNHFVVSSPFHIWARRVFPVFHGFVQTGFAVTDCCYLSVMGLCLFLIFVCPQTTNSLQADHQLPVLPRLNCLRQDAGTVASAAVR